MIELDRRTFLGCTGATVLGLIVAPAVVFAETPDRQFAWKREEILFGAQAGFDDARKGIPIGVHVVEGAPMWLVAAGMEYWNAFSRQARGVDFLYPEADLRKAKIIVKPSGRNFANNKPDYGVPYTSSEVEIKDLDPRVMAHEFGHSVFGFVDFLPALDKSPHIRPQRCDLPDKPINSIMSQFAIRKDFDFTREDDIQMLITAGYLQPMNG